MRKQLKNLAVLVAGGVLGLSFAWSGGAYAQTPHQRPDVSTELVCQNFNGGVQCRWV